MPLHSPLLFAFWSDLFGFLLAVLLLGGIYIWYQLRQRQLAAHHGLRLRPATPPDPFSAQHITHTFVAALPRLCPELNLEVATSQQPEFFERTDQRTILGISLGTNLAHLRVPVTYRYHLRLTEPWRLEVKDQHLIVHAPVLRAALPPAIHTDQMETRIERGWCRGAPDALLRDLHREVTPLLCRWAEDEQHLGMVRETARQQVAEFVRRWLEGETRWGPRTFTAITVRLGGETLPPVQPTRSLFLTPA